MFVAAVADHAGYVPQLRTRGFGVARWRHVYTITTVPPSPMSHNLPLHYHHHQQQQQQQQLYRQTGAMLFVNNESVQISSKRYTDCPAVVSVGAISCLLLVLPESAFI